MNRLYRLEEDVIGNPLYSIYHVEGISGEVHFLGWYIYKL